MARKRRTDSIAAMTARYREQEPMSWPLEITTLENLTNRAKSYSIFAKLVAGKDQQDWRPSDVLLLAELSNCHVQADLMFNRLVSDNFEVEKTLGDGRLPRWRIGVDADRR